MACEKNQSAAVKSAGANGIPKNSSKSAFVVGAQSAALLAPADQAKNGSVKNSGLPQNGTGGRSQAKKSDKKPKTRLERIKELQQRAKDRQAQKELLAKSRRALTAKNVKAFHQAIKEQKKVVVRYQSAGNTREATVVPIDVKRGQTEKTQQNRYMWCYFEKRDLSLPLKLGDVVSVKQSDETVDLKGLAKNSRWWKTKLKKKEWTLPRDWNSAKKPDAQRVAQKKPDKKK